MITFDIKTNAKNNVHKAYKFAMFDGKKKFSQFNYNATELFEAMVKRKYKNYSAYSHNLS